VNLARARPFAFAAAVLLASALAGVPVRAQSEPVPTDPPRVALVLGGGAARGAAHVGVLQELVTAGVPIDMILGTSSGALIGGLYAAGFTLDAVLELLALVDPATTAQLRVPPRGGLLDNAPLGRLLEALLQERSVSDAHIPFRAVVTDLATGEPWAPADAPLALVMQASAAVPILFRPVAVGGRLAVDGGPRRTIPTENARQLGADYVIVVDVTRDADADPASIEGAAVLALAALEAPYTEASLREADVVIRPTLPDGPQLDFERAEAYVDAGRRAARERLPAIREDLARRDVPLRPGGDPNRDHPINDGWRERVAAAAAQAEPPQVRLALRLDASSALALDPTGLDDHLGVAFTVHGWPLPWASVGVDLRRGSEPQANLVALRLGAGLPQAIEVHAGLGVRLVGGPSLRLGVRREAVADLTLGVAHDLLDGVSDATASYRPEHLWLDARVAGRIGHWARVDVDARGALGDPAAGAGSPELGVRLFALAASAATPDAYAVRVDPMHYRTASTSTLTHGLVGGSLEFRTALHDPMWLADLAEFTTRGRAFLDVVRHDGRTRAGIGLGVTLEGALVGVVPFRLQLDAGVDLTEGTVRVGLRNGADGPTPWWPAAGDP